MDASLPSTSVLLHAVAAAALAVLGVGLSRWLGVVRSLPPVLVGRLGWALGVAAVAVGALLLGVWLHQSEGTEASFGWEAIAPGGGAVVYEGSYEPLPVAGDGVGPLPVLLGVPVLALVWAAAAVRGARRRPESHPAAPPALVAQAAGVWAVTLPLQAALLAWEVDLTMLLVGAAVALVGAAAVSTGRPTATDVGDVLAATGTWLAASATWPGPPSTYAGPLVAATLVVVRRGRRQVS